MENKNKKRWLAAGLALIVFLISAFSDGSKDIKEKQEANFYDQARQRLMGAEDEVLYGTNKAQRIMVVNVDGLIANDDSNDYIVEKLDEALDDDTIKGVILHVNSPGGSVYASEKIAKKIEEVKEKNIPVYSVMQELAASGGYYISAPCDKIYASNETFTGSIGVIMQSYSLEGLFEKYGIKEQNIKTGKMKDAGSTGRDMDKEEKEYFQGLVDSAFSRFVKVVADGRDMSEDEVRKLADGRVYDGSQAVKNGLVDEIGDLDDAVADITEKGELFDPMVVEKNELANSFSKYFPEFSTNTENPKSDLAILKEFMESEGNKPMYLYGAYNE
ncbi:MULTISPECIES: signal peptide peptidase SppA [Anaerococcus]|jgi:signal peptide peptidase sppA, 36K type|uniref:Signal peptide peptidase SppA n=1 Tax=Anaerococcus octavius TaxID=54007 RepID=A0A2I1MBR5_9FIRM|nr:MULTISPECIES: signal peptide peptidase SppA [Anaerococcus]MDU4025836.1 signal peptide peptidase SppA [Anaerococcus sp.]MDU7410906.1 signal peptide peptidase SppA [Anaerococcus sp.]PKZ17558.1 signal peptide peptidase SppA [Anaerococcus octavius]